MKGIPLQAGLRHSTVASLVAVVFVAIASIAGIFAGPDRYAQSGTVLVSVGADVANLAVALMVAVACGLTWRGHAAALLVWPGGLFYLVYAIVPYLVGAPFAPLLLADVVAILAGADALAVLWAHIDRTDVSKRAAHAPTRTVGVFLVLIGVLAYVGLFVTMITEFSGNAPDPATRGHWLSDWVLGTPLLVIAGVMLTRRLPFGSVLAPGALAVSAIGGVAFAVAAMVNNLAGQLSTDPWVIVVHVVISTASAAMVVWYLVRGSAPQDVVGSRLPHPA